MVPSSTPPETVICAVADVQERPRARADVLIARGAPFVVRKHASAAPGGDIALRVRGGRLGDRDAFRARLAEERLELVEQVAVGERIADVFGDRRTQNCGSRV